MSTVRGIPISEIYFKNDKIRPVENYQDGFSYENLAKFVYRKYQLKYISSNEPFFTYIAQSVFYTPTAFYWIVKSEQNGLIQKGRKFHVSLAHAGENVALGWNLIKDILIKHQVHLFKVISKNWSFRASRRIRRCGKEITIYAFREKRDISDWQKILTEITETLASNNILPGPLAPSETPIQGSNYISYRNDRIEIDRIDTPSIEDLVHDSDPEISDNKSSLSKFESCSALMINENERKESGTLNNVEGKVSSKNSNIFDDLDITPVEESLSSDTLEEEIIEDNDLYKNIIINAKITQPNRPIFVKPPKSSYPANFFDDPESDIDEDIDEDLDNINAIHDIANINLSFTTLSTQMLNTTSDSIHLATTDQSFDSSDYELTLISSCESKNDHKEDWNDEIVPSADNNLNYSSNRFFKDKQKENLRINNNSLESQNLEIESSKTCCHCNII